MPVFTALKPPHPMMRQGFDLEAKRRHIGDQLRVHQLFGSAPVPAQRFAAR